MVRREGDENQGGLLLLERSNQDFCLEHDVSSKSPKCRLTVQNPEFFLWWIDTYMFIDHSRQNQRRPTKAQRHASAKNTKVILCTRVDSSFSKEAKKFFLRRSVLCEYTRESWTEVIHPRAKRPNSQISIIRVLGEGEPSESETRS